MDQYIQNLAEIGDAEPSCRRSLGRVTWSCLATVFACTWLAIHPNISLERESAWIVVWRRAGLMIAMILVPEMVVCWALRQYILTRYIAKEYKDVGWTKTHAFFLIMGGFQYIESIGGKSVGKTLTYDKMVEMELQKDIPHAVSVKQIEDRSKADWLAKSVVIIQTFWFCMQLFTRLGQGLTVTELEISTLAFAALNLIVYLLWWNKPFDVRSQIPVTDVNINNSPRTLTAIEKETETKAKVYLGKKWDNIKLSFEEMASPEDVFDYLLNPLSVFYGVFIAPFTTIYVEYTPPGQLLRKTSPYNPSNGSNALKKHGRVMCLLFNSSCQWALVSVVALVFGGVHLIAWSFVFPSDVEKWMWRGSSIALMAPAILFQLCRVWISFLNSNLAGSNSLARTVLLILSISVAVLLGITYLLGRFIILVLPFVALRRLPPGSHTEINWAAFIPHF